MSARLVLQSVVGRSAAFLVVLAMLILAATDVRADEPLQIRSIEFVAGQKAAVPEPNTAWQSHSLPMRWSSSSGSRQGLWLRMGFDLAELPTEGWGLLLQRLPTGGTVYLNGHMVAELPVDSETQRVRWRRPHLINLPPEFLRVGRNEALIYTSYGNGVHGVGAIEVGPAADLRPRPSRACIACNARPCSC